MKNALFTFVADITAGFIKILDWIYGGVRMGVAKIGWFVMKMIDGERVKAYEELTEALENPQDPGELSAQHTELNLLNAATQVRDHAKETGVWTEQHSDAIEAIGNALLDLNWEEGSIHQYLKEVVESIDGLEYTDHFE